MMDVMTSYLYGSLNSDIYMKLPEGFNIPEARNYGSRENYYIELNKYLYELKESGCMWYNRLSEYLLNDEYTNNLICICIWKKFAILVIYVNDIHVIGTPEE